MSAESVLLQQCTGLTDREHDLFLALVRRDWAVRVLDAWALAGRGTKAHTARSVMLRRHDSGVTVFLETATDSHSHHGPTPDAARLAAAEAVWPELPESVRAELGERP